MEDHQVESVPVRIVDESTVDAEYAVELARAVMPNKRSVVRASRDATSFHLRSISAGVLSLDWTRTVMDLRSEVDPVQEIVIMTGAHGMLSARSGEEQHSIGPSQTLLVATGERVTFESRIFASLNVRLPLETLAIVAAERTGIRPADFRFTGMRPVSAEMERYWMSMADLARREIVGGGATLANPILHAATVDMFAAAALVTFPNTTMAQQYAPGVGHLGSRSLRRAVAFMDAMASRPITISDVATAAGTTPRALQAAFRSAFDMTPMEYLQRVRLDGGRQDADPIPAPGPRRASDLPPALQRAVAFMAANADSAVTVADVAAAAFVSVRSLQMMFRRHLGVTPMAHLRRIRLERAHEDLRADRGPRAALTVAEVAHRWGFCSPSRFAAYYKQAYGSSPGETLGARR